jgi:hypothetical protein
MITATALGQTRYFRTREEARVWIELMKAEHARQEQDRVTEFRAILALNRHCSEMMDQLGLTGPPTAWYRVLNPLV